MLFFLVILIFGSADVEKLKKLILHNPFILTLPEVGNIKDEVIPKNVQQFSVRFAVSIVLFMKTIIPF
jgi:ATP-dependent RNA helicase DDX56/DBP9